MNDFISQKKTQEFLGRANSCYQVNEFEEAILLADKALALAIKQKNHDIQSASLLIQMQSQMSLGRLSDAKKISEKFLHLTSEKCAIPVHINALIESGYLYQQYLEYKKAEDLTAEAVVLARDNDLVDLEADALIQLATLDRHRRNFKEALVYIRQAEQLTRTSKRRNARIDASLEKGLLFSASGEYENALEIFEEVEKHSTKLKLHDFQIECIMCRGDVYRATGDIDKAERLYGKALDIMDKHNKNGDTSEILKRVGYLLLHRRDYEKALRWYAFAEKQIARFKAESFFPFVYLGYGAAYNGLENYTQALTYFWKALDLLAPHYLLHADMLKQILEQLDLAYRNMRQESKSRNMLDLIRRIGELIFTGVDSSHGTGQTTKILERDLSELLGSLRSDEVPYFTRAGLRVDLASRAIYRDGKRTKRGLTELQLRIFNLLITNIGHPLPNAAIIGCYENDPKGMESDSMPRRAHYFIRELRRKLGKHVIQTVKGEGYMIPSE